MRDNIFGWSYPPGCSGPPEEEECHPIIDDIYGILDDAGTPDRVINLVIDKVNSLIDEYERKLWKLETKSLPEESIFDDDYLDQYSDRFR